MMPADKSRYPDAWPKISKLIHRLAGNCCEWCGVPSGFIRPSGARVLLTVAHLGAPLATGSGWKPGDKTNKRDVRRENLACLCNECHLRFDLDEHVFNASQTRGKKRQEQAEQSGQLALHLPGTETAKAPALAGIEPERFRPGRHVRRGKWQASVPCQLALFESEAGNE